jgi:hypothetical protein
MNKQLCTFIVIAVFGLGILAVPVSAHFTMGNHTSSYPYRTNNFDKHVDGLQGYVFPGSGLFTTGAPGWYHGTASGEYPGYQSPWPYKSLSNTPPSGVPLPFPSTGPAGWYQLDANNYAPFGAILTSTIKAGTPFTTMWKANRWSSDNPTIESLDIEQAAKGDLILAINVTSTQKDAWSFAHPTWTAVNFTLAEIAIAPEFTGITRNKVVTSFTNNYDLITVGSRNREDYRYGPYWTLLDAYTDTKAFGDDQTTFDKMDDAPDSWLIPNTGVGTTNGFAFSPWKTFGNITFSLVLDDSAPQRYPDEWYYIRINDVTAPTIAGAYMFKFRRLNGPDLGDVFFPYQNWPVVLVKGEIDPAIITGTLRYGGWNTTLYGQAITLPGRVRAVGIADDPYTGKSTGRPVEARGYLDAAWNGHYEVEGVAPGVYDVYASAAGYPEIKIASNIKLLRGQSFHLDGYLTPGVQIRGTVFSKCGTGEVPFFNNPKGGDIYDGWLAGPLANIKIEIYRQIVDGKVTGDAESMTPGGWDSKAVTWSPFDLGGLPWSPMSFPWSVGGFSEAAPKALWGVGPSQDWMVIFGATSFNFQFGREGIYGAPADMDGHVPGLDWTSSDHNGATWVSGVGPGTYSVRAWLYGYVQTQVDGVTFMPAVFSVSSVEWPGNVYLPFDLRLSSFVSKVVHFHDVPGTLAENPIGWGWSYKGINGHGAIYQRYLAMELIAPGSSNYHNRQGESVYAWRVDSVPVASARRRITTRGFSAFGLDYGWGRNYGIPAGTYTAKAYMWGYVEQQFEQVSLGLCGTNVTLSDHLYRGAKFNVTLYSQDWQHPTADKQWSFPYQPIYVKMMKDGTQLGPFWDYYVMPMAMQGWQNTSVAMWPYMWNNPFHMIRTHDGAAQVFGPDRYQCNWGGLTTYYNDFFGPSHTFDGSTYPDFRYYDGSENWQYYYDLPSSYGQGSTVGYYPYSFESGIYQFKALTYGYVQRNPIQAYATKGNATADIAIKLTQGAEIQATMKFKHQGVFEGIPFDAHLRVRVLNEANKIVGEYLTSDWWWQPQYQWTEGANGALRYNWNLVRTTPQNPIAPLVAPNARARGYPQGHQNYWRLNYVPQGTTEVRVVINGLPDMYGWVSGYSCNPCRATGDYGWADRPTDAPYGIDAYSINDPTSYKGGWKLQVHVVPVFDYYPGHPYSPIEVGKPPPIYPLAPTNPTGFQGMLMGELTYTTDLTPNPENHLGPYELRYDVNIPSTHYGGEASTVFELDRLGLVSGTVVGYTYVDDWRTTSWAQVKFLPAAGPWAKTGLTYYTFDGRFNAWLPGDVNPPNTPYTYAAKRTIGPYKVSVISPGYKPVPAMSVAVSDGAFSTFNVYLERSNVPIPEFPAAATALASALAASLFILRRKRK